MFSRVIVAVICLVVLSVGCAGSPRMAFSKDGKQVWEVKCNGLARTIADCHSQASQKCSGEYDVFSSDGTSSFVPMNGGLMPVNKRSLLFTCRS